MNENENLTATQPQSNSLYRQLIAPLSSPNAHLRTTARLVALLLFLRIPWIYFMYPIVALIRLLPGFGSSIYLAGTAALVACLIWHERDHLRQFHIDRLAVMLFVIGKPFELWLIALGRRPTPIAVLPLYALYPLAPLWLLWKLRRKWTELPRTPAGLLRWMLAGIGLGILYGFASRYFIWVQSGGALAHLEALLLGSWFTPVFAFAIALGFGWLVWRSRSIATTITAHALTNGIGTFMY